MNSACMQVFMVRVGGRKSAEHTVVNALKMYHTIGTIRSTPDPAKPRDRDSLDRIKCRPLLGLPTWDTIVLLQPQPYHRWWLASASRNWSRCLRKPELLSRA